MSKKFRLTKANYYSQEANRAYFSASQIKSFLQCPARTMAELRGEWTQPMGTALLVGSYVDAAFDGKKAFDAFLAEHPEIFKRGGELKADFVKAQEMVDRAKADPVFMDFMRGRKQTIKTGTIAGIPFKCKYDVYKKGERIVDLKTTKDTKPMYRPGEGRMSFADYWRWPLQMAIYQALEGNHLPCYLAVITKEDPPGLALVEIEQEVLDTELELLEKQLPYFDAVKSGIVEAERCEDCAYCRATRRLKGARPLEFFKEIGGNQDE